jgi:5-methylcytosine-specific restriction protein A
MAQSIPEGIRRDHILAAIHDLDAGVHHTFGDSTRYDLLYEGQRYPPKAVIGLAAGRILDTPLGPYDFKGGLESKCFRVLEENGFTVVEKEPETNTVLRTQEERHDEHRNPDWTRDELIVALNVYLQTAPTLPAKDSEVILELSHNLNRLGEKLFPPEERSDTFRNPNGVYMKLMNFKRLDPTYTSQGKVGLSRGAAGEQEVWDEFQSDPNRCARVARAILESLDDNEVGTAWIGPDADEGLEEAPEGRILTKKHLVRERNRKLVQSKINRVLQQTSKLECEVCSFNFAATYGSRGDGFIECHHTKPVATLDAQSKTHIDDLALVCSNCHRMIHRSRPWLSLDELRMALPNCPPQ